MPEVALEVNGRAYGGWQSIRITTGIEQVAGTFELEVSEKQPGNPVAREVVAGDRCAVLLDDTTVIEGFVDTLQVHSGPGEHTVMVAGRDRTADLVDCSAIHQPGQWSGVKIDRIARDLLKPFGIQLRTTVDVGDELEKFALLREETVFEAIERLCRMRGVLPVSDGRGSLLFTRAGAERAPTALVLGQNVRAATSEDTWVDRFSEYTGIVQRGDPDAGDDEQLAKISAKAEDPQVTRHRPFLFVEQEGTDAETLKKRVQWEANRRAGRSRFIDYLVAGWHHEGALWRSNTSVQVRDAWMGVNQELLIAAVLYSLDNDGGSLTSLKVCRAEAFDVEPLSEKPKEELWKLE